MKVVIDFDGTITANPDFFRHLVYLLYKNEVQIYILSAAKLERNITSDLIKWGITTVAISLMEPHNSDWKKQMQWKIAKVKAYEADIWIDNDFKMWDRIFQVDVKKALPKTTIIQI